VACLPCSDAIQVLQTRPPMRSCHLHCPYSDAPPIRTPISFHLFNRRPMIPALFTTHARLISDISHDAVTSPHGQSRRSHTPQAWSITAHSLQSQRMVNHSAFHCNHNAWSLTAHSLQSQRMVNHSAALHSLQSQRMVNHSAALQSWPITNSQQSRTTQTRPHADPSAALSSHSRIVTH
jgi:hypothetical protein